ncbi:MAG: hypothetical protein JJT75_06770 [Opitutales bacterium]|nr:hypothetical protein [Opitutales bacterium]MCH8541492.1 hypothetical protein [Opitutales bacterium]
MNDFDLDIADNKTVYLPGETLHGTLRWVLDKAPKSIEVVLFWSTQGKGTQDSGVVVREEWPKPGPFGEKSFTFKLPHAPLSFHGKLISLEWGLEAIAHRAKRQTVTKLIISPSGENISLGDPQTDNFLADKPKWIRWLIKG